MLKGISKNVVEVVDVESPYFERAILFLKPDHPQEDEKNLRLWAGDYLRRVKYRPRRVISPGRVALKLLQFGGCVGLGLLLANFIR